MQNAKNQGFLNIPATHKPSSKSLNRQASGLEVCLMQKAIAVYG